MSLQIMTVIDSISKLNISGVKIRDIDEIRAAVNDRDCPILIPEPLNLVSNISIIRDSMGDPSTARKTARYTLAYTFLYQKIGADREGGIANYADMVRTAARVIDTIIANDWVSGLVELWPASITEFGQVPDPTGSMFLGCRMQLQVMEFIN